MYTKSTASYRRREHIHNSNQNDSQYIILRKVNEVPKKKKKQNRKNNNKVKIECISHVD